MTRQRLIVIGNGMAGLRFLEELCNLEQDIYDITVIGAEPYPAYNRVLLSAALSGDIQKGEVQLRSQDWYRDNNITLLTDTKVTSIHPDSKSLTLSDNSVLSWNRLVLACGSQPILLPLPGSDLDGVMTFRSMQDVADMEKAALSKRNAVVIGGGLLGLETAYGLNKLGMNVTLLHLMDKLMERQLDDPAAQILKEEIEKQGIKVILKANTACFTGADEIIAVQLKTGELIPTDLVVMAVGIKPNIELAKQAGLECARGIVVSDTMQTSDNDIFALGECAQHRGIAYGLVEPLYEQARVLANNLVQGDTSRYEGSSVSTNLKVSGVEIFSAGLFEDSADLDTLVYRDKSSGIYKKLLISKDKNGEEYLVGSVLVGERQDGPWYSELIRDHTPISHIRDTIIFGRDVTELAA